MNYDTWFRALSNIIILVHELHPGLFVSMFFFSFLYRSKLVLLLGERNVHMQEWLKTCNLKLKQDQPY